VPVVTLVLVAMSAPASAACDVAGIDAAAIAAGRDAIDAGCPCAAATSRRDYRHCATDVVKARVDAAQLSRGCRRETLRHAKLSICGWPGAAVCCRVRPDGRERHRVVSDAAKCVNTHNLVACVSSAQSVPTGCDATGCISTGTSSSTSTSTTSSSSTSIPPGCGNGIVESGEDCDPPDYLFCAGDCLSTACPPPTTSCGNGTLDPGEGCEPPGVGACGDDCQPATCATAVAGEIVLACDVAAAAVGAAASSTEYLVGWSDAAAGQTSAIVARRYDPDGAAIDPARIVVSADAPCESQSDSLALASDGQDFYAVWDVEAPATLDRPIFAILGRRIAGDGTTATLDTLASMIPVGFPQGYVSGPTTAVGVSPARFAVGWVEGSGGFGFQNPEGRLLDFNPPGTSTDVPLGFGVPSPPPSAASSSPANVGSSFLDESLWVWHAIAAENPSPPYDYFIAAVVTSPSPTPAPARLTSRTALVGGRPAVSGRPTAVAGSGGPTGPIGLYLVAWSQGASDIATVVTEIRAGRIDFFEAAPEQGFVPDGGLLLATSATHVTGGPVVAFDETSFRWLIVWAEASGSTNELRAVAMDSDGTVVDASPRLVASDVEPGEPAVATVGDGRVLVVFARPNGTTRDVLATLVTP
jgi:hypothetical protein